MPKKEQLESCKKTTKENLNDITVAFHPQIAMFKPLFYFTVGVNRSNVL